MDNNLPEALYIAGEREAEIAEVRAELAAYTPCEEYGHRFELCGERLTSCLDCGEPNLEEPIGMFDEVVVMLNA